MCVRQEGGTYTHMYTLTHRSQAVIRQTQQSDPYSDPPGRTEPTQRTTQDHGLLSPLKSPPHPPSLFISKKEFQTVMAESLETSLTDWVATTSLLPLPPPPPVSSWRMPLIPRCRLEALLGSQVEEVWHLQPLVNTGLDTVMEKILKYCSLLK